MRYHLVCKAWRSVRPEDAQVPRLLFIVEKHRIFANLDQRLRFKEEFDVEVRRFRGRLVHAASEHRMVDACVGPDRRDTRRSSALLGRTGMEVRSGC